MGVVIGAAVASLIAIEFGLRAPALKVILQTFLGGFLLAFVAVCSSGCNIGHILSGVPMLSLGSILGKEPLPVRERFFYEIVHGHSADTTSRMAATVTYSEGATNPHFPAY